MSAKMPQKRQDLEISPLGEDLIAYDPISEVASCLNKTAATVLAKCDGSTPQGEVASSLAPGEIGTQLLELTLSELSKKKLLLTELASGFSRREFLGRWGKAAALLPLIAAVAAPSPAQAQSVGPPDPKPDFETPPDQTDFVPL